MERKREKENRRFQNRGDEDKRGAMERGICTEKKGAEREDLRKDFRKGDIEDKKEDRHEEDCPLGTDVISMSSFDLHLVELSTTT
jgi:hypothetical protein